MIVLWIEPSQIGNDFGGTYGNHCLPLKLTYTNKCNFEYFLVKFVLLHIALNLIFVLVFCVPFHIPAYTVTLKDLLPQLCSLVWYK